jgi:hypothetical protein
LSIGRSAPGAQRPAGAGRRERYLAFDSGDEDSALAELRGHSIAYRIAFGPQRGRKAFMLQSLPPRGEPPSNERVAQAAGFSLHAGVVAAADQRGTLERLCRYVARPAVAIERLSLTAQGHVRYALKSPYQDGTTHVIFEPLDFLARLAALVPSPGVNLTRYHGVFASNRHLRARIVPGQRGRGRSAGQCGAKVRRDDLGAAPQTRLRASRSIPASAAAAQSR